MDLVKGSASGIREPGARTGWESEIRRGGQPVMQMQGSDGGPYIIGLAYMMSCIGCGLGLLAMVRARASEGSARQRWLALGALAIGGTGIWIMHFIAMLGYSIANVTIKYNLPITIASLLLAIVVVWFGLRAAVVGDGGVPALIPAGLVTGIGVAGMHYLGMAGMSMQATVRYRIWVVVLSVVIAVVAATVALWFAVNLRSAAAMIGAALVMGAAVTGMHYTGVAAMDVTSNPGASVSGLSSTQLLVPLAIVACLSTFAILLTLGLSPTAQELDREAQIKENLRKLSAMREHTDPNLRDAR
ncbi:MAG TPA: MHYT domain-containing protein [Actinospica sp.]|nr:MHYT domain-containing protein [Actinospica sp.]